MERILILSGMIAKSIVVFIAVLLSAASCISEPLAESGGGTDGTRTPVTLSIRGGRFPGEELAGEQFASGTPITGRALSEAQETVISQLQLLVFNSKGEVVLNERFKNLTLTDGMYRLQTELLPGNGMQLYVIANADVANLFAENLPVLLNSITRLSELESLIANLQNGNNGLNRTDRLLMTGSATVDVTKPHRNAIPLTLNYLCAKVTVTLTDNTSNPLDIDITGWDMVNIPRKTNLLEQIGRDAVTGTNPNDYLTTASKFPFESGSKQTKTWSQTCYLLENRRGGRVDRADPTNPADKYPGMGVGDSDQRGKAWYAPAGATCLLVYGTHTQNGQANNIIYKIYLGENAVSDYNLTRGKHYKYNVTINGLKDINVDTNVEWGPASFTLDKSDNLLMDAHPDCRVLRIGGTAVDNATPAYATVEVMGGVSWLSLSPLNLYRHAVKQMEQPGYEHQQFAANDGIGSFVRTRYSAVTHTAEYQNALFGMTRQLTKIPFTQPAVCTYQDVLVYADNYTGSSDRTAQVCVTYYNGTTVAGQQTLDITQSGAIPVSADLFVERYEESAMKLHPALADELQRTSVMQWGYGTELLYGDNDRFSNGYYLTANAVYNTVAARAGMATPQWTAGSYAAYLAKYPRTGAAVSESGSMVTSGAPYYYPDLQASTLVTSYFHPIYNSSAARYCHEKNRDLDGDGIINANETLWYLPSYADMVAIKKNPPTTQLLTGTYWTSTEESADKCWAFTFPGGTAVMADKNTAYRVRCVRGTGTVIPEATIESEESDKTKLTLFPVAGASGLLKITDDKDFGFTWTVTSSVPAWLQIATDSQGTAAGTTQTGIGNAALYAYATTANTIMSSRNATLTLTRMAMATTPAKTVVVNQTYFQPIRGGNSNCYIVAPGSAVSIPVERANESTIELTESAYNATTQTYYQLFPEMSWTAALVWESSVGLISLSDNTGTGALGSFKVTATNASTQGNAVVAIKNADNEILWSWHIWVTDYDGSACFTTNNGKRDYVFMNIALGATSATPGNLNSCGLMYQWGRKDPFSGLGQEGGSWSVALGADPVRVYDSSGTAYAIKKEHVPIVAPNNLTNATRNPDTYYHNANSPYDWFIYNSNSAQNNYLWSGGNHALTIAAPKSVFDPCPAGWRVPPWLNNTSPFAAMYRGWSWNYGMNWAGGAYFPSSGCRASKIYGNIYDVGTNGYGWEGSPVNTGSYFFAFTSGQVSTSIGDRAFGFPIRCCKDDLN